MLETRPWSQRTSREALNFDTFLSGPLLVHPPILVQVPRDLVPDHHLTALTLVALQDTALSQAAGPGNGFLDLKVMVYCFPNTR